MPSVARTSPGILARFVRDVRVAVPRRAGEPVTVDHLPDGSSILIFRWFGARHDISVRGPMRSAHYKVASAPALSVVVRFRPGGAYPFFGRPLSELAGQIVPLDELWLAETRRLHDRLAGCRGDPGAAVAAIEDALVARMHAQPFEPTSELAVRAALRHIDAGATSIAEVARTLHISERTLRRGFHAAVGLGPKAYARISRFQRAVAIGRAHPGTWADVARRVGYFDQAHLIAEFHDLARRAPTELARFAGPREDCEPGATPLR